mmetsp:Transcript_10530/g.36753  ORF Transcript_10530/g.36753 Transcript_10530/m.36753 type:complete len:235 (-) Transcript_10530:1280-1984(-)
MTAPSRGKSSTISIAHTRDRRNVPHRHSLRVDSRPCRSRRLKVERLGSAGAAGLLAHALHARLLPLVLRVLVVWHDGVLVGRPIPRRLAGDAAHIVGQLVRRVPALREQLRLLLLLLPALALRHLAAALGLALRVSRSPVVGPARRLEAGSLFALRLGRRAGRGCLRRRLGVPCRRRQRRGPFVRRLSRRGVVEVLAVKVVIETLDPSLRVCGGRLGLRRLRLLRCALSRGVQL